MKFIGILIMIFVLSACAYVGWHLWQILPFGNGGKTFCTLLYVLWLLSLPACFAIGFDRMPMAVAPTAYRISSVFVFALLYLFMIFVVLDAGRLLHLVPGTFLRSSTAGTLTMVLVIGIVFAYGFAHYFHKQRRVLDIRTEKPLPKSLKIVFLSDLHLGYNNRKGDFAKWIEMVNAEQPDLVLVGGDIIDGYMRPLEVDGMAVDFHRIAAPVYACLGNHEYITGIDRSVRFYQEAGIHLLRDEETNVLGINVVGRDDRSNRHRRELSDLATDTAPFTIVLDHQPFHLEEAERQGIDLQLSGHTHYGQVWPISWIEDLIYEKACGYLEKGGTRYYVSSGMGIWGPRLRIGTHSEYVVLQVTSTATAP